MNKKKAFTFTSKVFLWPGETANWYFVSVPKQDSVYIKEHYGAHAKGFRSLPVTVTLGKTVWDTSIFPDSHSGCYLLPLKAAVRKKESIYAEDEVSLNITLR